MDNTSDHEAVVVKMEDPIRESPFMDHFTTGGLLDYYYPTSSMSMSMSELVDQKQRTLGFMELLGMQDSSSCALDNASTSTMSPQVPPVSSSQEPGGPGVAQTRRTSQFEIETSKAETAALVVVLVPEESPDVFINDEPATPNSSSISSEESSGARNIGDHHHHHEQISRSAVDDHEYGPEKHEQQPRKTNKKHLKAKKTSEKKLQKEPRFAFMTKSEVDHLEDGYRWRKYGQKAVKNSPFPRSYYRCTSASCNVKKRVERTFNDPSIVVTTYEGRHIHSSPIMHHRPPPPCPAATGLALLPQGPCFSPTTLAGFGLPMPMQMQMALSQQPQHLNNNLTLPLHCGFKSTCTISPATPLERPLLATLRPSTALLRDDGLLQDIVSPPDDMGRLQLAIYN